MQQQSPLVERIKSKISKPDSETDITLKSLPSFSNDVYRVEVKEGETSKHYMFKIFRDYLVEFGNKQVENDVVKKLSEQKQTAPIIYSNNECRLQEFIEGKNPKTETCPQQLLFQLIDRLTTVSTITAEYVQGKPKEFQQMRKIQPMFSKFEQIVKECQQQHPEAYNIIKEFTEKVLAPEVRQNLQKIVPKVMLPSHNDCHFYNVLVTQKGQLYLLDYQFFSPNYRGFDLGNFFNEYSTDYQKFEIKPELQMKEQLKTQLVKRYYGKLASDVSLDEANHQVEIGRMLSHLFWLFIGVKQIRDPKLEMDMDYYVKRRYEEFNKLYQKLQK